MVIIFCERITPRITYTLNIIFNEVLGIACEIINNREIFNQSKERKINYSKAKFANCFTIDPAGLLEQTGLTENKIEFGSWKNFPVFFNRPTGDMPFDLFSAVFYLVSRYEEYLPFQEDAFGRFEAKKSIASKGDFLHLPVIDLWCIELAKVLDICKSCKNIQEEKYKFQLTIDVDHAWVFKNKGLVYFTGGLIKDIVFLKFKKFHHRIQVLCNCLPDPGYTFDYLKEIQNKLSRQIKYFVLCSGKGKYDRNISAGNKNFQRLLKTLDNNSSIGIHPSYASNKSFNILEKELKCLSEILERKVEISRQHYLKLKLPDTYRNLIRLGIHEDYSMGFGSRTGFRAGIARPFYFYDLYEEKQTLLRVIPFQIMDRTLLSYLKYSPEQAEKEMEYYTTTIKSVGGTFVSLWHNDSLGNFGEWQGWRSVFEKMIELNQNS
ncbi:MAG: polysaccharide deacetylase family protein [Bacteroidales bacterium]|nr:polysaccharide deacetylase family protein [Bacteroidales bacterium]